MLKQHLFCKKQVLLFEENCSRKKYEKETELTLNNSKSKLMKRINTGNVFLEKPDEEKVSNAESTAKEKCIESCLK